ncbi:sigma-54 dependent transcriptional regulator [Azospirillum sp. TSO22-1]|uniref:sigma-54-dependent transcriptional regulator n=1 Tax=Azospirillum sp. TSO22-1 TaxID=716789 RepID=UPI000D605B15|nr:sigma-54 dependent transcriptional regulator [Azospirillum sp. TSO22-1]PWC52925.1 AAA family ATPase [Azospirillum sp. TSO22-1]
MLSAPATVLLVEDTPSLARVYAEYLKKEAFTVVAVETGAAALDAVSDGAPRIVLLDLQLPDMHGMEVLRRIEAQGLPCAVVVITAHGSVNVAVEAMRHGAYDFLVKPFSAERLIVTVRNAVERLRLAQLVDTYREDLARTRYHGFIGSSLAMQAVYRIIDSAAASRATVFITGESGTGKEVCAEAIHRQSPRGDKPFVAINCGAIPKDLMESEIFGHMKGSFTGAVADREGAAARANGGTLFLDEICELEPNLQTKLLRFIQTGTFMPVGGNKLEKVDLRIVCATNRDPLREVEEGRFREDLYYRLHVIPIHLPALREREDDVIEVARHILVEYAREEGKGFQRFAPEAEQVLRLYHWPGNVRQLQNVVRNIVVLHDGDTVLPGTLPPPLAPQAASPPPLAAVTPAAGPKTIRPLWQIEKDAIEDAITACDGNIPRAAALLDISASTIYRKRLAWQAEGKI